MDTEEAVPLHQPGSESPSDSASTPAIVLESCNNQEPDLEDIEEGRHAYRQGGFHPVFLGDVFNKRYKVLNKIG